MDDELDRDAVRLLSAWLAARRELTAHLDLLTAFGPHAAQQVARNLGLVDDLQERVYAAWSAYRAYVLRTAADRARQSEQQTEQ